MNTEATMTFTYLIKAATYMYCDLQVVIQHEYLHNVRGDFQYGRMAVDDIRFYDNTCAIQTSK